MWIYEEQTQVTLMSHLCWKLQATLSPQVPQVPQVPARPAPYLAQLQAERRDADLPEPPERLQAERRGAAGQQLDERQEVEVIITDEELEQDVQRTGEHAVRHGHGDPRQPAPEHVHGGSPEDESGGGLPHSLVSPGFTGGEGGGFYARR